MAKPHVAISAKYQLEVVANFDALPAAMDQLSCWLEERQAAPAALYLSMLALEELVTNCIKYGYDDQAEHVIQVQVELSPDGMTIVVEDDGHPFNPLEQVEPDTNLPVEERPLGGLGLHLLRKLSDRIDYAWKNGRNRVTLHKKTQA
jgi:anti-sigma regulatory factor (Ser/Thr protein kinase)